MTAGSELVGPKAKISQDGERLRTASLLWSLLRLALLLLWHLASFMVECEPPTFVVLLAEYLMMCDPTKLYMHGLAASLRRGFVVSFSLAIGAFHLIAAYSE